MAASDNKVEVPVEQQRKILCKFCSNWFNNVSCPSAFHVGIE